MTPANCWKFFGAGACTNKKHLAGEVVSVKYIKPEEEAYIRSKYVPVPEDVLKHNRFRRRDDLFDSETGDAPEAIEAGVLAQDAEISHLSHPERKARALEYILTHTRLRCDGRDLFPAIHMVDRPLNRLLISRWAGEVFSQKIPAVEEKRARMERDGIVTIWPDYDHSVPVWERLLALGFPGILAESERIRGEKPRNEAENGFFEGIRISYGAMLQLLERLQTLAEAAPGCEKMAAALGKLRLGPPESFYEALLLIYLYFIVSEHIDGVQTRSLSNFDRLLVRFYRHDRENGVEETEIRRTLACFFLQFTAIGNYFNQPVYLGGENADGTTVINELSYLFLDVYDEMEIYNPKIQIKVADSMPREFLRKALDMVRRGHNCIVFVSDATMRRALTRAGATEDQARLCDVTGCYEYAVQGSYQSAMNYLNLLKPLEYALHQGRDGVTGVFSGTESPALEEYTDFDKLYQAYLRQLSALIDVTVETVNGFEGYLAEINPLSLLSGTFPSCLERAKDAIGGGSVRNDTILMAGFLADAVDSLMMLKKYVFEEKLLMLPEFVAALDANFAGYEKLQRRLRLDREKYGNNRARPDAIAVALAEFITGYLNGRRNAPVRGGEWNCGFHVARMSYVQGEVTAASPNGRSLGEELSKNLSASMGQNREGATAAVLSVTKIDASSFLCDAALDLGLLPSAVRGDDGLDAMCALVNTFAHRGGHALHINVFDADTLRKAQREPEKYRDLQIRVCGWNVLWNNINRAEQDGFIRQAEGLV